MEKRPPSTYAVMFVDLKRETVFRIPPGRKDYFEHPDLFFGAKVSSAFPSCARDIQKAEAGTPLSEKMRVSTT
jgi:hypothetical protein